MSTQKLAEVCLFCKHYQDRSSIFFGGCRGYCRHPIASLPRQPATPQYLPGAFPWDCLCREFPEKFPCVYRNTVGYHEGDCCKMHGGDNGDLCPYGARAVLHTEAVEIRPLEISNEKATSWADCVGFEQQDDETLERMFRNRMLDVLNDADIMDERRKALVKLGFAKKNNAENFEKPALELLSEIEPGLPNRISDSGEAARCLLRWVASSLSARVSYRALQYGGMTIALHHHCDVFERLVLEMEAKAMEKFSKKEKKHTNRANKTKRTNNKSGKEEPNAK